MKKYNVKVKVGIKPTIKDIRALTLKQAVNNLLKVENFDCRLGNTYDLSFDAEDEDKARDIVQSICSEILANSVIEEYEVVWQ